MLADLVRAEEDWKDWIFLPAYWLIKKVNNQKLKNNSKPENSLKWGNTYQVNNKKV